MSQSRDFFSPRYEILGYLGHGGEGDVYEVFDHIESSTAALKILQGTGDNWAEAKKLRALEDSHILPSRPLLARGPGSPILRQSPLVGPHADHSKRRHAALI